MAIYQPVGMQNSTMTSASAEQRAPDAAPRLAERQAVYVGSEVYRRQAFGTNHPLNIMRHSTVLDLVRMLDWLPEGSFHDATPGQRRDACRIS